MEYGILYVRVSSIEQAQGYSSDSQIKLLREYANKFGHNIKKEFIEAESAKKAGRTQFGEMLKFIANNKTIKHILVEKTDRLLRNFADCMHINDLIERENVSVHLVKECTLLHKDSGSNAKMMFGIRAVVAKNFIDNLSEETKKGMLEKAEQKIYPSFAIWGYTNTEINKRKVLIPDPSAAPHVKKMFELYATGNYSLLSLKRKMLEDGMIYRNGKNFYKSTVTRILQNEFYTGVFYWKGKKYENAQHEPLISPQLYRQVQAMMKKPTGKYKSHKNEFVFTNLIQCGVCKFSVTAQIQKKRYVYYHCSGYTKFLNQPNCNQSYLREELIDEQISSVIEQINIPCDTEQTILQDAKNSLQERINYQRTCAEQIEQQLKIIQNRIDQSYLDKLDGKISENFWKEQTNKWFAEKEHLKIKLDSYAKPKTDHIEKTQSILELAKNASKLYKIANAEQKRKLMNNLFSNCSLRDGLLDLELHEPYSLILESAKSGIWRP